MVSRRRTPSPALQRLSLRLLLIQRTRLDFTEAELESLSRSYGASPAEIERMAAEIRERRRAQA